MRDGGEWVYRPEEVAAAILAADAVVVGDGYLAGALGCRRLAVLAPPLGDWCWGMPQHRCTLVPSRQDLSRHGDAARH